MIDRRLLSCTVSLFTLVAALPAFTAESPDHPVIAAFERFHAGKPASADAGRLLITELSCTACHATPEAELSAKNGPVLDGVGGRISADWMRQFLADPQAAKPGTTMPHVLASLPAAERTDAVESLVHFLAASAKPIGKPQRITPNAAFERGALLFHEVGCVACHAPDASHKPATQPVAIAAKSERVSVPLPDLRAKYSLESLMQFLLRPLDHRPAGRMPDLMLDPQSAADIAAYLVGWTEVHTTRSANPTAIVPMKTDAKRVADGRKLFASLNCAACHTMAGAKAAAPVTPLADLKAFDTGCVAAKPAAASPHFALSALQRDSIATAARVGIRKSLPADRVTATMERLNCYACHARDDRGGPDAALVPHLAGDPDLADEGRFPPALTGVGRKLTPDWLTKILGHEGRLRPYLKTRMPVFGPDAVAHLPKDFVAADGGMKADADKLFAGGDVEAGRKLIGGTGLSCITCHSLADKLAIGIHAMDLSQTPDRLQPDWFRQNLVNPAALRPGTLMPTFWPDGKAANDEILGGDTDKQVAAIWAYLRDGKQPPEGYPPARGEFELIADERPIIMRCFMKHAGTHAIAVGFPQQVHVAFDADAVRPAMLWRGRFLDAYSTWFSRAQPAVEPLGRDWMVLPAEMPLARLSQPDAEWPRATGVDAGYAFKGYRLDKAGVPTFLYTFGNLKIEDRFDPADDGGRLRRTMVVHGAGDDVYFRPPTTEKLTVKLLQPADGKPDSPMKLTFEDGKATLQMEYQW